MRQAFGEQNDFTTFAIRFTAMTLTCLQTNKADLSITSEGHIHIKIRENEEIDLDEILAINSAKHELSGGMQHTVIFDAPKFGNITPDAMQFAGSTECNRNAIAKAVITKSLAIRIISNFFIKFHQPAAPTRTFNSMSEATEWLTKKRTEKGG